MDFKSEQVQRSYLEYRRSLPAFDIVQECALFDFFDAVQTNSSRMLVFLLLSLFLWINTLKKYFAL